MTNVTQMVHTFFLYELRSPMHVQGLPPNRGLYAGGLKKRQTLRLTQISHMI
jgi:hypothetical protein